VTFDRGQIPHSPHSDTMLCVKDRQVWKVYTPGLTAPWIKAHSSTRCVICGEKGRSMGDRWRAPKQSNEAAWKRIEAGDFLWDKKVKKSRYFRSVSTTEARRNKKYRKSEIADLLKEAYKRRRNAHRW
jgi:hypothetical protein